MMRVAMYYNNKDVRLEEMPEPDIGPGDMLVKPMASGICGSDVMEWYRVARAPLVLGHEIAGTVAKMGEGIEQFKVGDRIAASHHVPCNECHYCSRSNHTVCDLMQKTSFDPGGFAEYVRVPAINLEKGGVYNLQDGVSFEEGTFVEPLACVLRGQRRASVEDGQTVLVLGSGISGILHLQLARLRGARRVFATDVVDFRLKMALELGADNALNAKEDIPSRLLELNDGRLADIVIVCTGAESAVLQALNSVEKGGTILFFAPAGPETSLPIPLNDVFWRRDVTLTTSYAGSPADHLEAAELIASGKLDVKGMITHRLGLSETGKGFRLVAEAMDSLKVIVEPQS
jgi:L-iditol 2-dehydrogenase